MLRINQVVERIQDPSFALQIIQVIRFAAVFLVSVLLVKVGVSNSTIGSYEYVLFIASILTGVWTNGVFQSFLLQSGGQESNRRLLLFRRYSIFVFVLSFILFLAIYFCGDFFIRLLGFNELPRGFYFFIGFHFVFHGSYLVALKYFLEGKVFKMYCFGLSFFFSYLVVFSLFAIEGIELYQVFQVLAVVGGLYFLFWIREYKLHVDLGRFQNVKIHFKGFSVLLFIQAIAALSLWSDSWWVQYFYGNGEAFALFRYGAREFPLFIILNAAFGTAMLGYLSSDKEMGMARIKKGSRRFIYSFGILYVLLMIFSNTLYKSFYSADYIQSSVIFDMYLTIVVVRVIFPRSVLIGHKLYVGLIGISLMELGLNIFLSYYLHEIFGVSGLIFATVLAHFIEMVVMVIYLKMVKGIRGRDYAPLGEFTGFVIFVIVIFVTKYLVHGFDKLAINF